MTAHPHPFETEDAVALREQINHLERQENERRREWWKQQRGRMDRYEAMLLTQRPTYPTPDHLASFERIAMMLRRGIVYGDHLGYPRPGVDDPLPRSVRFGSKTGRINVMALSPYRADSSGGRLWCFTEEEVAAMREDLEGRHGLTVIDDWAHDDGHTFRAVAPKNSKED